MKISVLGAGYVGLVTGACLANFGHEVCCIDIDAEKISKLQRGLCPIYEPGLEALLSQNLEKGNLSFTCDLSQGLKGAEVIFIAVGTPTSRRGNGYADMAYVYEAAKSLAVFIKDGAVVVNKSTVPVGSAAQVGRLIQELRPEINFDMASNPEFLREGAAVQDFMQPDRLVLGCRSEHAKAKLMRVYQPLAAADVPILWTSPETAELIKYASNAFLATKISFINEMANLCEAVGADVRDVAVGMGLDARIGPKFLHPGPGYGGSCFPKDTLALLRISQEAGVPCRIVETVVEVNNAQKSRMIAKIKAALGEISGKTLAVLGLTFKPETDDMRDAPSLTILPALLDRGMIIKAHDPVGMNEARKVMPELNYCVDAYQACEGADAVCLMTEWKDYLVIDLKHLKGLLKQPVFIDLRNAYRPEVMSAHGYRYVGIGHKV